MNFFMLYFVVACGGGAKEKTEATIQIFSGVAQLSVNNATGGLVLWGRNDRGDHFSRVIDATNGTVELTLRNGTWVFSSMAWDHATNSFEGNVRCGITQPTQLTGADLDLGLNLTNATCNQAPFLGSGTMNVSSGPIYAFPKFRPFNCQNLPPSLTSGANCDDSSTATNRGHIGSYKVELRSFDFMAGNFSPKSGLLQSRCMKVNPSSPTNDPNRSIATWDGTNNVELNLPLGNGTIQLAFRIIGFYGNESCDATSGTERGAKEFVFDRGIGINNSQVAFWTGNIASIEYLHVFLKSTDPEVCTGNNLGASPFAAGSGTATNPYVICTPSQFNNIGVANITHNFRVGRDLDFQFGTFIPIGGTTSATSPTPFQENFLGNGHTISNIKFNVPNSHTHYGLFRKIDSGGMINNLTIFNSSFTGDVNSADYLGTVAGEILKTSASVNINNIFVMNSKIMGSGFLGSIFGKGNGVIMSNVHALGLVKGISNYVGGLFGTFVGSGGSLSIASFKGDVDTDSNYAGGIFGSFAATNGTFELMRSEGRIEAEDYVGGLIGGSNSTTSPTVQNSYSISSIHGRNISSPYRKAGLIGQVSSGLTLTKSFHTLGTISGIGSAGCVGVNSGTISNAFHSGTSNGLCSSTSYTSIRDNSVISGLGSIASDSTLSGYNWFKASADNNNDFPQLFWEKSLENTKLPYLKRSCSGYFSGTSSGIGSGTASNPYWVCSGLQLVNMVSTNYYKLMAHIDLSLNQNNTSGTKITNAPNLDGNGFRITNLSSSFSSTFYGTMAYFGTLGSGKTIKNLIFDYPSFSYTVTDTTNTAGVNMAAILSSNQGTLDNVVINGGQMNIGGQFSLANNTNLSHFIGMLTAYNTGTIKNSRLNGKISYSSVLNNTTSPGDFLLSGGITAQNDGGSIEKCFAGHEFIKSGMQYFDNLFYGHIAGENSNNGIVKQSKAVGRISNLVASTITLSPTNHYVGGIIGKNNMSKIENTMSTVSFNLSPSISLVGKAGGLVGYNYKGEIKKSFYQKIGLDNDFYSTMTKGGLIGSDNNDSSNIYQDLFCFDGGTTGTPFGTSTGLNYGNSGTYTNIMEDGTSVLPKCMTTLTGKSFSSGVLTLNDSGNNISYQTDPNYVLIGTSSSAPWIYTGGDEFLTLKDVY